jgi:capsular exopolysaccharide synthesis family protein
MSRIYDALERAAHTSEEASATGAAPLPTPLEGAALRAADGANAGEFPESEGGADDGAAAALDSTKRATRSGGETLAVRDGSLLEHIDARLVEKIVLNDTMAFAPREQYRRLAGVLHDGQNTTGLRVVMIASAVAGEGKTLTAANLAMTLSESYQKRVLLIDADLRRPTLHQLFTTNTAGGLSEGLDPDTKTMFVVRQLSRNLSLLPAGRPTHDPMAALVSDRMRQLIAEARETYDWVIVDTPPLVLLPDAKLLGAMVDGAVLVVRAESTPHELIRRATESIGRRRILGVVLNQAKATPNSGYSYDGYNYYDAHAESK